MGGRDVERGDDGKWRGRRERTKGSGGVAQGKEGWEKFEKGEREAASVIERQECE